MPLDTFSAIVESLKENNQGRERQARETGNLERTVRNIRRVTRKKYTAEDKIRIVLEGLQGETGIRELCCREGIPTNLYYAWSKEFLEAGKQRQVGRPVARAHE